MNRWDPETYHRHSSQQQKWARELLAKLPLAGDERVLDIGCGEGKVTAEIAQRVARGSILGVDNSPEMIDFATRHYPPDNHPNLRFSLKDASSLDFADQFDVVFSNAALHWVSDHRPVLHGICRALRTGGRALLQMGGAGNGVDIEALLRQMMAEPRWRGFFTGFTSPYGFHAPPECNRWLAEAGLHADRVELIPKDMLHAGRDGLAGWVRTTWLPYTQRVPESMRPVFLDEFVSRYIANHRPDSEGQVHVRMFRLEVEARKLDPSSL